MEETLLILQESQYYSLLESSSISQVAKGGSAHIQSQAFCVGQGVENQGRPHSERKTPRRCQFCNALQKVESMKRAEAERLAKAEELP